MTANWHLTVDCADTSRLVSFWCEALGYVPEPAPDGWDSWLDYWRAAGLPEEEREGAEDGSGAIVDPEGVRPRIWFQEVPEPKSVKNRLHLDLRPDDQAAEVRRLESLGAQRVSVGQGDEVTWVVLADPEGNEFCVLRALTAEELARA